jgi:hypothetical protein
MKRIFQHIDQKISDIRMSDDTTKAVWLYGLTTFFSLIVIGLWVGFEQYSLPTVAAPIGAPQLAANTNTSAAPGITETFRVGANVVTESLGARFTRGLALMKDALLGSGNKINVSGADRNFIPDGLAPLEQGVLPK